MFNIENKSNEVIHHAVNVRASDIHILPITHHSVIQFRIDNRLMSIETLKNDEAEKLIAHFKFRSKMDIGERRRPQSGSLNMLVYDEKINIRLSTLPTIPHESLSIRILPQTEVETLQHLSLFPKHTSMLNNLIKKQHGLLLVSGPTGSGKTTTIYSLLNEAVKTNKRIICIEDPVEKRTDSLIQVEINKKAGLTYSEALKAALRHDPDIIMIGEIRDRETAQIAVRAAMTGHLVISTIHAKSCTGSLSRLLELGIKRLDINETVIGLISQRLVEMRCQVCGESCSEFCRSYRKRRRVAIYEILAGETLDMFLTTGQRDIRFESLEMSFKKGIALGYVNSKEFERWLC